MIEARAYDESCTEQEREALRQRVQRLDDDTLFYEEVPVPSPFQVELMFARLRELTVDLPRFYYVVDLRVAERPSAELRELLKQGFHEFKHRIVHASVFTGKNFMLNVAVKFVFNGFGFRSFSVHKTREEAMAAIEKARAS